MVLVPLTTVSPHLPASGERDTRLRAAHHPGTIPLSLAGAWDDAGMGQW